MLPFDVLTGHQLSIFNRPLKILLNLDADKSIYCFLIAAINRMKFADAARSNTDSKYPYLILRRSFSKLHLILKQ